MFHLDLSRISHDGSKTSLINSGIKIYRAQSNTAPMFMGRRGIAGEQS